MRTVLEALLGGMLAALAVAGAHAQPASPAASSASAAAPMTAASRQVPARNPAITAAENAKEPGNQRPEERVVPQITIPIKPRNIALPAATAASAPAAGLAGRVNEGAARCVALGNVADRADCERRLAASAPGK
ncbi:hypothetical protein ACS5PN_02080 [Roseateles sp. NT4]|uniref:hypothetical protein n=1 Tax=Roseateles sp. NT4 TaxID=3453715 RepID=UPI003EEA9C72